MRYFNSKKTPKGEEIATIGLFLGLSQRGEEREKRETKRETGGDRRKYSPFSLENRSKKPLFRQNIDRCP